MLRNLLVVAYRGITRNLSYTLINVLGLSAGLSACLVIFLVVKFELSFDTFHENSDRLFRVTRASSNASGLHHSAITPYPFAAAFRNDFNDIPLNTQFHYHEEVQATIGTEKYKAAHILFADSMFFKVFSYETLSGNPAVDLGQPGKVFLTETLASKILKPGITHLTLDNKLEVEVVGIVKDPPANSHIRFSMIVSMPSLGKDFLGLPIDQWGMNMSGYSYLVLPAGMSTQAVEERLESFVKKYYVSEDASRQTYSLQPLNEIHFDERYIDTPGGQGYINRSSLLILSLLGAFILVVGCINFVNLSTAMAVKKSREIGVRKTLGASRNQLIAQYLSEAFLLTVVSTGFALLISELTLPFINQFLQKEISLNWNNGMLPAFLGGLILVTAVLSGLYPAFVLSAFNPVTVLKNKLSYQGSSGAYARKYLVVFQFMIAQMLIIGTLVVANQMNYLGSKPLGFTRDAIINIPLPETKKEKRESLNTLLESLPGVEKVSFSLGAPTSNSNFGTGYYLTERGNADRYEVAIKPVDYNYLETYGIELVAGRWFYENEEKMTDLSLPVEDRKYVCLVNEALVRQLGFSTNEEILDKLINIGLNDMDVPVVGVVRDFHTASLHQTIGPVALIQFPYFYYDAGIRINTASTNVVLKSIEDAYAKVFPEYLFNYTFLDNHLENLYRQEKQSLTLVQIFSGLAILISCLGLLGLVSFLTQQKVKEVGIRKVFGASVGNIVLLFSRNFIGLVLIAFLLAAPISWYAMNQWLQAFAYKTTIGYAVFGIAVFGTLVVAFLTVMYQSVKAALANPTLSLRNE